MSAFSETLRPQRRVLVVESTHKPWASQISARLLVGEHAERTLARQLIDHIKDQKALKSQGDASWTSTAGPVSEIEVR